MAQLQLDYHFYLKQNTKMSLPSNEDTMIVSELRFMAARKGLSLNQSPSNLLKNVPLRVKNCSLCLLPSHIISRLYLSMTSPTWIIKLSITGSLTAYVMYVHSCLVKYLDTIRSLRIRNIELVLMITQRNLDTYHSLEQSWTLAGHSRQGKGPSLLCLPDQL